MFQQAAGSNIRPDEEEFTESVDVYGDATCPTPSMGELLYPGFNQIVPYIVELVIPNLSTLTSKEAQILIELFYQLLEFAFKT